MDYDNTTSVVKNCEICSKGFGITRHRHSCKRCKLSVCSNCTKISSIIIGYQDETPLVPHKICIYCQAEEEFQTQFRTNEKASWNTMSKIGLKWLQLPQVLEYSASQTHNYDHYLKLANQLGKTNNIHIQTIEEEAERDTFEKEFFNYPMLEFLHYIQGKLTKEEIRMNVCNVLKAIALKYDKIGYQQGLSHLVIFLLCMLNETNTFLMLSYIIDEILPKGFYEKNQLTQLYGYQVENYLIYKAIIHEWSLTKSEDIQNLLIFFEEIELPLIQTLLIDSINFESLFCLWNKVIEKKSFKEFERYLIGLLNNTKPQILDKKFEWNFPKYQLYVCKYVLKHNIEKSMSMITDKFIEGLYDQNFILKCSRAWIETQNHYYKTFELFSKFNNNDMKLINENIENYLKDHKKGKLKGDYTDKIILERQEFISFIQDILPKRYDKEITNTITEKFFYFIDYDNKRKFALTHLIVTLTLLNIGTIADKIAYGYTFFDSNDKGYLDPREFKKFINSLCNSLWSMRRFLMNPFFPKDLLNFHRKINKQAKKFEIINKTYVDVELYIKIGFNPYFDMIQRVSSLMIAPNLALEEMIMKNDYCKEVQDKDNSIPQPDYRRNATIRRVVSNKFDDFDVPSSFDEKNINEVKKSSQEAQEDNKEDTPSNKQANNQQTIYYMHILHQQEKYGTGPRYTLYVCFHK